MRVLLTGANGFIGRHLAQELAQAGHEVISCSRSPAGPEHTVGHIQHDFASSEPLPDVGPLDAVIHLAAASSVIEAQEDPARVFRVNVQGTLDAILYAQERNARFVLASSQRVYHMALLPLQEEVLKRPVDLYGYTKLAAELYVEMAARLQGLAAVILRPFAVYGPGQLIVRGNSGVVSILAQRALAHQEMRITNRFPKDFVNVTDVAGAFVRALDVCQAPARAYNIGTGRPTTILDLAQVLTRITGSRSSIVEDYSQNEPGGLVANTERARRELGFEAQVGLEEGLHTYVKWLSIEQQSGEQQSRPD